MPIRPFFSLNRTINLKPKNFLFALFVYPYSYLFCSLTVLQYLSTLFNIRTCGSPNTRGCSPNTRGRSPKIRGTSPNIRGISPNTRGFSPKNRGQKWGKMGHVSMKTMPKIKELL